MADVIDQLVSAHGIYPWHTWMDGRPWEAKKGRDFSCSAKGFRSAVYMAARRAGRKVTVAGSGNTIGFQFGPKKKARK